ncbi:MAG: M23 family metallopeptidase [Termitinemataceae bacterium]|nr:MAG: M23 family metallopeptidase [Termitinemataceae bacterium]
MAGQNNSILKTQHVKRRKNTYSVHGSSALQGLEQHPLKRQLPLSKIPPPLRFTQQNDAPPSYNRAAVVKKSSLSPTLLLVILSGTAVLFFSLYALLWSYDPIEIKPTDDEIIKKRLLSYAAANANIVIPTDDYIFNTNESFSWKNYVVKKGDTVSKIALDNAVSMDAIIASNDMKNARSLRQGEILRIPNMDGIPYKVASGDSLKKISDKFNVPVEAILDANDIQDDNIKAGSVYFIPGAKMRPEDLKLVLGDFFIYPVIGRLSSTYGWRKDPFTGLRRYHRALDLAAPFGSAVKAASSGKVRTIGYNDTFGNYIILTHSEGFRSMYAHLKTVSVKKDAFVNQGDKIGEVGNTGHSTGAHLHFAIHKNGTAVNPLEYLK